MKKAIKICIKSISNCKGKRSLKRNLMVTEVKTNFEKKNLRKMKSTRQRKNWPKKKRQRKNCIKSQDKRNTAEKL